MVLAALLTAHLVRTSPTTGITDEQVRELLEFARAIQL
jgi:hypothetical protein